MSRFPIAFRSPLILRTPHTQSSFSPCGCMSPDRFFGFPIASGSIRPLGLPQLASSQDIGSPLGGFLNGSEPDERSLGGCSDLSPITVPWSASAASVAPFYEDISFTKRSEYAQMHVLGAIIGCVARLGWAQYRKASVFCQQCMRTYGHAFSDFGLRSAQCCLPTRHSAATPRRTPSTVLHGPRSKRPARR